MDVEEARRYSSPTIGLATVPGPANDYTNSNKVGSLWDMDTLLAALCTPYAESIVKRLEIMRYRLNSTSEALVMSVEYRDIAEALALLGSYMVKSKSLPCDFLAMWAMVRSVLPTRVQFDLIKKAVVEATARSGLASHLGATVIGSGLVNLLALIAK